jgi:hypothetical protein
MTVGQLFPMTMKGILPNDGIIRRVSGQHVIFDPKIGGNRLSSSLFEPSSGHNGGLSVDLQSQIEEAGLVARDFVTNPPFIGSIRFIACQFREEGFKVGYDPILNQPNLQDNPYHGEVWGNFSKVKKKRLFQLCSWFVPVENTSIQ